MPRRLILPFLLLLWALGATASPSQEFWEYMADFSDENGEVLDPLELDEVAVAKEQDVFESDATEEMSEINTGQGTVKKTEWKTSISSAPTESRKGSAL